MLRHYYISRSWMVSATARRVYRLAARFSLGLFLMLVVTPFLDGISGVFVPLYELLLFACILGAAITFVAMEYFLFGYDTSSATKKVLWFVLLVLPPVGPAIYCLTVYSRSEVLDKPGEQRPHGMVEEFRGIK